MTGDGPVDVGGILSEQELASLRFAQEIYGARAKEAAVEFADALNLDTTTRTQLVGGVALHLDGRDFETRREVALRLNELTGLLKGSSDKSDGQAVAELVLIDEQPKTTEAAPSDKPGEIIEDPKPTPELSKDERELSKPQINWLGRLFDQEDVELIAAMAPDERSQLFDRLTDQYQGLSIRRLSDEHKRTRAEQLKMFMIEGKTNAEIAQKFDSRTGAIHLGLRTVAESIKKRLTPQEIKNLVRLNESKQELTTADPEKQGELEKQIKPGLTKIQKRWLGKIFAADSIETISKDLTNAQLEFIANRLGRFINTAVIRSQGPVRTQRRLAEVTLLMQGNEYVEIARELGIDVSTVKQELHHSAARIKVVASSSALEKVVRDAKLVPAEK